MSGPDGASIGREGSKARKALKDQEQNGRKNGLQVFKRFPRGSQYLIISTYLVLTVCQILFLVLYIYYHLILTTILAGRYY